MEEVPGVVVGSTETRSPSWGTLGSLPEVSTCILYSASIMGHLVENGEYVHVYSSCSAQKEPCKGTGQGGLSIEGQRSYVKLLRCLGTATDI